MRKSLTAVCFVLSICVCCGASGGTWYVDGSVGVSGDGTTWETAKKTIQEGIDAASGGDMVLVAPGRYLENIQFKGKNMVLRSSDASGGLLVSATIIDGRQAGTVVTFAGTEDETCVLSGFTIRNGNGPVGGGICGSTGDDHTRATIENNVVTSNSADYGGGIAICAGAIVNNTICDNTAAKTGAALCACQGVIRNCIVWGNKGGQQSDQSSIPAYSCVEGGAEGGEGNIGYYPHFVDAEKGDYRLQSWSPCIDAGDPASLFSEEPQPNGGRINMGAYGNTAEAASKSPDNDEDGLPDDWEMQFFGDLAQGTDDDPDVDFASNLEEYRRGSDPSTWKSREWYVDGSVAATGDGTSWQKAFKWIQQGIDVSSHRDIVTVKPGTYRQNVNFKGKNIVLRSTDPLDPTVVAGTIIDGEQARSVVTFAGTEGEPCVLSGFTLRNGNAGDGGGIRGGTRESHTHATIRHNVITQNRAGDGGGISRCDGLIEHNQIIGNVAEVGGGLYDCSGTIQNNAIAGNSEGGGLADCNGTIQNNVISRNSAEWSGGGLLNCGGTIQNNTVAFNSARWAGGLYGCSGKILNCIIWGNGGGSELSECSVPTYCCVEGWSGRDEGNIPFNPDFLDAEKGDFHLRSWSPCIDAGDPTFPFSNEPQPNGGRVNMGAYGNTPEAACKSLDTDADGLPDGWELAWFGGLEDDGSGDPDGDRILNVREYRYGWHPGAAPPTLVENLTKAEFYQAIQAALVESDDGDEIVVYPGVYGENISFGDKNVVLRSTDPSDSVVVASTVIDGSRGGPVVTFSGTENERCVLSGFTIRNGRADFGGGIRGGTEGATIADNVVVRNEGGGVAYCDGTIQNNTISENSGAGLASCHGIIQNNLIAGNSGDGHYGCGGVIQNNTVVSNSGSALRNCEGTIRNCIIWGNTGLQISYDSPTWWFPDLPMQPTHSVIQDWDGGGEGNISEDPGFVEPNRHDFRLKADSPCIDAGLSYYWCAWPQRDLDGNCRLAGERVDMGCYEYGSSSDSDGDLFADDDESAAGTDPHEADTEGDGLRDGLELLRGSDPLAPTAPRIVHVPSNVPSIQEALCLSVEGDEIVVNPGVYPVNLQFCGPDVILRSFDPENPDTVASTVLDGGEAGSVVRFAGNESEACVLSGFTVQNGISGFGGGICGGAEDRRTHATIQNNIITGNSAINGGGGLAFCDGNIQKNTITANSVPSHFVRGGGGLCDCDGVIQNNTISDNWAACRGGGGLSGCDGIIRNNTITRNGLCCMWGVGAGLFECQGVIANNTITGGFAIWSGGVCSCGGIIESNTICHNDGTGVCCAGLLGAPPCTPIIRNCIVWGNSGVQVSEGTVPTFSCIQDWTGGGEGNIAEAPLFVDPDGLDDDPETCEDNDYHLAYGSPCIDAGANEEWMFDAVDLDGRLRILDGTVDMGAYEYEYAPLVVWYVDDSVYASGDGKSWETAFKKVQHGIDAAKSGQIVTVAEGIYAGGIEFKGKNITLQSTDPLAPIVVANTIIDGYKKSSAVTFAGTEKEACVLSGFTIRNGIASFGAGILGNGTLATIQNNLIINNIADWSGGGLHGCHGLIQNNTIRGNSAAVEGGGLSDCQGVIQNNTITQNSAQYGGGLASCNGTIRSNVVTENSADKDGGGLAYCYEVIQNNTIAKNSAANDGGGLYWCDALIQNNIISGNSAGGEGGGLSWCWAAIQNNTIIANSAVSGGGMASCEGLFCNSIIWANSSTDGAQLWESSDPTYSCIQDCTEDGRRNTAQAPQFVDADNGNFRLSPSSPCIDAGDSSVVMPDDTDRAGMHRMLYGGKSMTVDMGAYEFYINLCERGAKPDEVTLTWSSLADTTYSIFYCSDILSWQLAVDDFPSAGNGVTSWTDDGSLTGVPPSLAPCRFYRILENP